MLEKKNANSTMNIILNYCAIVIDKSVTRVWRFTLFRRALYIAKHATVKKKKKEKKKLSGFCEYSSRSDKKYFGHSYFSAPKFIMSMLN